MNMILLLVLASPGEVGVDVSAHVKLGNRNADSVLFSHNSGITHCYTMPTQLTTGPTWRR